MRVGLRAGLRPGVAFTALAGLLAWGCSLAWAEDSANFSGSGREFIAIIQAEVAELEAKRDALEASARIAAGQVADSKAEIETLAIEAAAANERATKAKAAAEARLAELDAQARKRQAEADALRGSLKANQEALAEGRSQVEALEEKRAGLVRTLAELKRPEGDFGQRQADLDRLQQDIEARQGDRDALNAEAAALDAKLAGLRQAAETAEAEQAAEAEKRAAAATATERAEARVKDLNGQLATLREAVRSAIGERDARMRESAEADARRATVVRSLDEIEARVKAAQDEEAAIGDRLTAERAELARSESVAAEVREAERRLAELQAAIEGATARQGELAATPVAASVPAPEAEMPAGLRSAAAVTAAVGTAPGLGEVSEAARAELISELESGACVTDALSAAVGSINRLTAAALVRGLGGC